jgi:hypothetical protein
MKPFSKSFDNFIKLTARAQLFISIFFFPWKKYLGDFLAIFNNIYHFDLVGRLPHK